jgi:hypothetical protein
MEGINMADGDLKLTAYCGLYCPDCIRNRNKIGQLAQQLLNEIDNSDFKQYAAATASSSSNPERRKIFQKYPEFHDLLEEIVSQQCENPCRINGGCSTFKCEILKCCISKDIEGCWKCNEYEQCIKFEFLKSWHGTTCIENIRQIKKHGSHNWAEYRSKFYTWQK